LLREQFIHARCRHVREQRRNAFIASQGNGSTDKILDGSATVSFHPSPRSVGNTRLGSRCLLGKVKSQAARFDPAAKACHQILECKHHQPYMADYVTKVNLLGQIWTIE
jgi:hypothetical protein